MTQFHNRFTAMTAMAASLALATPASAQDVAPAPLGTVPDPLAATPPSAEPVPSTEPAPSTTTPIDPLGATPVEAAPAPAPTTATRTTVIPETTGSSAPVRGATRGRSISRTTAAARPAPPSLDPVDTNTPLTVPVAAAPSAAALSAPAQRPQAPPAELANDDVLPIAVAGGLGLLALLGAGVALRRRKRRAEDAEFAAFDEPTFEAPRVPNAFAEPMREPALTRAPLAASVAATPDAPAASLPDGFDLSRFGPHVQAAYRGPSADNPSLSLKNRLRRAGAMDQMARTDGDPEQPVAAQPLTAPSPQRDIGAVVSKIRPAPSSGAFILGGGASRPLRPVNQH